MRYVMYPKVSAHFLFATVISARSHFTLVQINCKTFSVIVATRANGAGVFYPAVCPSIPSCSQEPGILGESN